MTDDIHVTHRPAPMRKWTDGGDGDEATNVGAGERSGVVCTWVKAMLSGIAVMVCFHSLQQYAVDVRHCRSTSMLAVNVIAARYHGLPSWLSVIAHNHGSLS